MCLINSPVRVRELLADDNSRWTFYKVVECIDTVSGIIFQSPYECMYQQETRWETGVIQSNAHTDSPSPRKRKMTINRGIHVFRDKERAERQVTYWNGDHVVLPVTCLKKDLLGASKTEAVFTKVRVLKKDYDQAVKKCLERSLVCA